MKYSLLELANVIKGGDHRDAIERSTAGAKVAEEYGYKRVWLAEHHNMPYVASSATSLLIQHIAANTSTIRVGSGGIMLPNHAPLVIAEQFGTLETLYPGRIDLGLGRAPGTDQTTAMALRRNNLNTSFYFKDDVTALQDYFQNDDPNAKVRAFPGEGLDIPMYILGSSTDSAYLAAELGLPYAFAAHFAPAMLHKAIEIYRANFKPSAHCDSPYVIICVNLIAATSDSRAEILSTSLLNMFCGILTNRRQPLSPPTEVPIYHGIAEIEQAIGAMASCTFTGTVATLQQKVEDFTKDLQPDEIMTTNYIYDEEERIASIKLISEVFSEKPE